MSECTKTAWLLYLAPSTENPVRERTYFWHLTAIICGRFFFCESPKASGPRAVHHVTHGASGRTVIHTAVQNCLSTSEEVLQASIANFPKASVKRSGCTSEAKLQLKLTTRRRLKTKLWDEEDGGGGEREMREKESDRERERNNRITPFR